MQLDLARTLSQITLLSPIDFEHQLLLVRESPLILKLLGELLASNLSGQQKQLAAVAVNQVVKHRLETDREQWRALWLEYLGCLLDGPQIEAIAWRHLKITGVALEKLMEQFQQQFCDCINPIFKGLHFKSKALIYQAFPYAQTTSNTKLIFIRETFEEYMSQALAFVCNSHESPPDQDRLKLELAVVENLSDVMAKLRLENDEKMVDLILSIGQSMEIFQLVIQELLFDPSRGGYESVMKHEFAPERMNELVLSTDHEESNIIKAKTIKVFVSLLTQYDEKSGMEEFDHHKYLFFMESLTPFVIEHLVTLAKRQRQEEKEITEQLLAFLTRSCNFIFMLETFEKLYQKIFYRICLPLLATNQEEHELYLTNCIEFGKMAEELIEQPDGKSETVKNAAGVFLEKVTHTIHGSLKFVVQTCVQAIKTVLLSQTFPEIAEAIENYDYKPSIDTALVILAIFSYAYQKRPDLYEYMYSDLMRLQGLLKLQELEKARLLIFLEYNYQQFFINNPEEGRRFLIYAEKGLDESLTVSYCSLLLFQNCLELGFGDDIWISLIKRIESTKSNIFSLLRTIVEKMLDKLPVERVKDLIARVIIRLVSEFKKCQENAKDGKVKGSKTLFSCLDIIGSIAENQAYLKQQPGIIDAIWPVFDMFLFAERIEFQDNILAIFNKILGVEKHLSHRHFAFLPFFLSIYEKQVEFGELLHTVNILVTKGRDYLLTEAQARADLEALLSFLRETYGVMKNQETLKHILVLFHYIHWEYNSVLALDRQFIVRLMEIYDLQREFMMDQTRAALLNFLLLCEFKYGGVDLSIIGENRIEIFRGYQGKLFAGGLRNVIEKQQGQEQLLTYLRYSIRLLHFIREIKLAPRPPLSEYYSPPFPETQQLDPFQQICQSLNHIKRTLPPHHYDRILAELNSEISLGQIKDLLSRRLVDNSLRAIKRVRQG